MDALLQWLDPILKATAWEMEIPPSYGAFHSSFTLIGFLVCFILAWSLRKLNDRQHKVFLLSLGIFLLICEVYKQLFYWRVVSPDAYSWGEFPFHLCSVPMYLCVIAPLLKKGKVQKSLYTFMMLFNLVGGSIAFTEPSGLFLPYVTLTWHALIWHMILVFVGLYLYFSDRGGHTMKDYKAACTVFCCLGAFAFMLNLLLWNVSNGQVNAFFIGPAVSSLIVFKQVGEMFGWYAGTALYIFALCLGAYLFFLPKYLRHRKKEHTTV